MFEKQLVEDLKKIFEVEKVKFQSLNDAIEQDVLYCDIEEVRESAYFGSFHFFIKGRLGINGQRETGNRYGYLIGRARQNSKMGKEILNRFNFWRPVQNVKYPDYSDFILQTEMRFTYSITVPYDKPNKAAGMILKIVEKIKEIFINE